MALGDLADLIDRPITANLKIWHLKEAIRDKDLSDEEVGRLTRKLYPVTRNGQFSRIE